MMSRIGLCLFALGLVLLSACAGTSPAPKVSEPLSRTENSPTGNAEGERREETSAPAEIEKSGTVEISLPDSASFKNVIIQADSLLPDKAEPFDAYVEISRIARKALSRADSFNALGMKDSVSAIVEQFFVLNPLWEEWQKYAKSLVEKKQQNAIANDESLKRLLIDFSNANARRVDFSEIRMIADSIRTFALDDPSRLLVDSVLRLAYSRTFEKVKKNRDAALTVAIEKAEFDDAERGLTDLLLRYPDFADTLQLRKSLIKISSLRAENATMSESYWKNHDPKLLLKEAQKLAAESKWNKAKDIFLKLKSSSLRGAAVRELDSLGSKFCTEKRQRAAALFAKSQRRTSDRTQALKDAVGELDLCLDFAPNYGERATVLSNKEFLLRELSK